MADFYTGSVPQSGDTTNVRDALYRAARLQVPLEVVLTKDPSNTVNQEYASANGYYAGLLPNQTPYDNTSLYVLGRYYHSIQVQTAQTTGFSIQVQGSLDGFTWVSVGSAISSAGITTFTGIYKYLRLNLTGLTLAAGPYTADYGVRVVYIGIAQQ